jgi:hypothetical protein
MSSAYAATSTCESIDIRMLAVYMLKSVGDSTPLDVKRQVVRCIVKL